MQVSPSISTRCAFIAPMQCQSGFCVHSSSLLGSCGPSYTIVPRTIAGPGASQVAISGDDAVGVVMVTAGTTATLSGITITAGSATNGAGVNNQGGNLTLISAAVTLNTSKTATAAELKMPLAGRSR